MRIRLPHPGWLILIVLILGVLGTMFPFWWKYRQMQAFLAEVDKVSRSLVYDYDAPDWLLSWAIEHDAQSWLEYLKTDIKSLSVDGDAVDDAWLKRVPGLRRLRNLGLPKLEYLYLNTTRITDASLALLGSRTTLHDLRLADTAITDAGLASLKGVAGLTYLDLSESRITDAGLASLKGLKKLSHLNLSNTQITDAGLAELKGLPALRELSLVRTNVTDAGLPHLKAMKFYDVNLSGTKVTPAGIQNLTLGSYRSH